MGIPLQPVEADISLGWAIHSQGNVAQCLCVFYHQGPSTCNPEACLSLIAQISHQRHHASVLSKPYVSIFPLLFSHPCICKSQSCCCGTFLWETMTTGVRVTLLPSFLYTLVTQWIKLNA